MSSLPTTIKALQSTATKGQPSKFEVVSLPFSSRKDIAELDPDSVIYKTVAVALNPTDTAALSNPATLTETPLVVGCDSSGTVLAVGSNVEHIKVGDRVASFVFGTYDEYNGAFAEAVKSNRKTTWVLPDEMSHLEGAAFT
ncbi:chaperonin 10-like protein, partial [Mrakia frigida]|uniref:chaperonin 10-like protein n=1 Tax=Mrakia frigida TaxID=29902 RepID=UPI003FCC122F